jgi:hypothetical protein
MDTTGAADVAAALGANAINGTAISATRAIEIAHAVSLFINIPSLSPGASTP